MRISLKVLGFMWIGLFLIIGVLLFNAYSKLKPETFIALITEQVQKNYPGSKLNVGNISYGFSLDFKLTLKDIHLRRKEKLLASVGEVELKIPWWLLLSNNGNAQINIKNLDIYVDNNPSEVTPSHSSGTKSDKVKVKVPAYLSDANFTLRAKKITIRDTEGSRRYFAVSKLLVREFQYGKNSAFELNIPVSIKHKTNRYASNLWLFGDVTPDSKSWKLNYRGEFRTKESNDKFQIEDLVIGGKSTFIPSTLKVDSEIKLEIDKKIVGSGKFTADQEALDLSLNVTALPVNYFGFVYEEIKNPYLVNPKNEATGNLNFRRLYDVPTATFSGKLNFEGVMVVTDKESIPGRWAMNFEDSKWELSFISPKGEASFFRRSIVDLKTGTVVQFIEEIGFSGLDLATMIVPVTPLHEVMKNDDSVYYSSTFSYKKCTLGDQVLDGTFKFGHSSDQKFYQTDISDANSSLTIRYSNKSGNALDVIAKNFNWHPSFKFLSPYFHATSGVLDGKFEGRWSDLWDEGQWLIQMKHSGFTAPQGKIPELINQTANQVGLNLRDFKSENVNVSGKNGTFTLTSLTLDGTESAKITGTLSTKQKSFLTLSYPKNKKLPSQKKDVVEVYWKQKEEL